LRRVLLDTHVLLWWLVDDPSLSDRARAEIADPASEALVSAVSVWEIAIKRSLGKLPGGEDLLDAVAHDGFTWLPVSERHAWEVASLPHHHADPFDRLLIAQARVEEMPIVTGDRHFDAYDVAISW
jgi:PIN domain nuclease of toxin-antitoxin system